MHAVASRLLGGRASAVRGGQDGGHVVAVHGDRDDADARAEPEAAIVPGKTEAVDGFAQMVGKLHGLGQGFAFHEHAELVTAEARQRVAPADARLEQGTELAEQRIACSVAAAVVDDLELIEVEIADGVVALTGLGTSERTLESALELAAIDEARSGCRDSPGSSGAG